VPFTLIFSVSKFTHCITSLYSILFTGHAQYTGLFIPRPSAPSSRTVRRGNVLSFIHRLKPSTVSAARLYSTSSSGKPEETPRLTHVDDSGRASMVDVSDKFPTKRTARAVGTIYVPRIAYELVTRSYPTSEVTEAPSSDVDRAAQKAMRKGDTLTVAQLAGIMGAKRTSELIPLCHPLSLSKISVTLSPEELQETENRYAILCEATVTCEGKTGVEMEALTAVSTALLTVWDMLKAVAGKEMEIGRIYVAHKSGGNSGDFDRKVLE
jgi:molybdenum cofactor biosynthesis protein MoaC